MPKLIRITTVPMALKHLLTGQMRYMKENGFDVIMVSADGKERNEVIKNESCEHFIIPMTRKITPFADLLSLWKMYRFFKKQKPDIIHSHTPKAGLISMLAGKMAGVKIRIHTIAGLRFMTASGMTRRILISAEKITAKAATHIFPNSFSLLEFSKEKKLVMPEKLNVIGFGSSNGIDLERFSLEKLDEKKMDQVKQLINFEDKLIYLLCVGRIVKDKGIHELLQAFVQLYPENENLRLILLGTFEEKLDPISEEDAQIIKTHPGVIHIEWNDDVEYFMHLAFSLVHPSHREGFPNVLLQAGAMKCPVACSRIPGNVDIVEDGQTGILFTVKDENDCKKKINFALQHPEWLKKYAGSLRKKIEERFSRKFVQESLKKKYYELLNEQRN